MAVVIWMSGRSSLRLGDRNVMPGGEVGNLLHVVTFAFLGHTLVRAIDPEARPIGLFRPAGVAACAVATLFGISDEVHQYFTPGRHCSLYDAFLDFLGAASALLLPRGDDFGRPRSRRPALIGFTLAAFLAIVTGRWRLPADGAIASILSLIGFTSG